MPSESTSRSDRPVIVLADDEPLVRRATSRLLQVMGYQVREAEDGLGAEAAVAASSPSDVVAVLLDLMMPGRSAVETVCAIRATAPSLPIVICSGYGPAELTEGLLNQPRVFVLQKPFNRDQLAEVLERLTPTPTAG